MDGDEDAETGGSPWPVAFPILADFPDSVVWKSSLTHYSLTQVAQYHTLAAEF